MEEKRLRRSSRPKAPVQYFPPTRKYTKNKKELSKQSNVPPRKKFKGVNLQETQAPQIQERENSQETINQGTFFSLEQDNGNSSPPSTEDKNKEHAIKDWNEWVTPSNLKNYLLDDSFLDILSMKSSAVIKANPSYSSEIGKMIGASTKVTGFVPNLLNAGISFESKIIALLTTKLGEKNVRDIGGNNNPRSTSKYLDTLAAIQEGVPCIFQAIVRNYEDKTYGVADILIRSDWINRFLDVNALSPEEVNVSAPKLHIKEIASSNRKKWNPKTKRYSTNVKVSKVIHKKCHYVVIDIKYKSLQLRADGVHLRNDGILKAYKSQLWIYTNALGKMQGYCPPYAFILGSKWKYESCKEKFEGNSCFERLGRIDYATLDTKWIDKTNDGIKWLADVRLYGDTWDLSKYPLPRPELYPNMNNVYDYPFHGIKQKFAEENNDLTLLWQVGPKQRKMAHEQGVYSWKDPRCTPEILGMNGKVNPIVLTRILEANKNESNNITPKYVVNNFWDWKNEEGRKLELYVDFETTCSVFNEMEDLPNHTGIGLIFLIGVGYISPVTKKWVYKEFIVNAITEVEEWRICCDFISFEESLRKTFKIKSPLTCYHWAHHEPSTWRKVFERNYGNPSSVFKTKSKHIKWVDMLKIFKKEPIGVKGCLNYGLKKISKAFYKYGYISSTWDASGGEGIADGCDAAVSAYRANLECIKLKTSFSKHSLTLDIIKYNEIDCKVLSEIMSYLRTHHIDPNGEDEEMVPLEGKEKRKTGRKRKTLIKRKRNIKDEDSENEDDDNDDEDYF